jgi:hypothetical protein
MSAFAKKLENVKVEKKSAAKKSTMPVIENAPENVKLAVDAVNEAKVELNAAKAKLAKNETIVIDFVKPIQDKDGFAGNHKKSYEVKGVEGAVKFVTSNKFSVSSEDEGNLTDLLGEERFNERFEKSESLSVKAEIFKDEKLQEKLLALIGDNFDEFFEYTATLKIKEDFDKKQFELTEDEVSDLRVFCKQAKAALK